MLCILLHYLKEWDGIKILMLRINICKIRNSSSNSLIRINILSKKWPTCKANLLNNNIINNNKITIILNNSIIILNNKDNINKNNKFMLNIKKRRSLFTNFGEIELIYIFYELFEY